MLACDTKCGLPDRRLALPAPVSQYAFRQASPPTVHVEYGTVRPSRVYTLLERPHAVGAVRGPARVWARLSVSATPEESSAPAAAADRAENPFSFWARPLILGILVIVLLFLNRWDQTRVADRPLNRDLFRNTPAAAPVNGGAMDPALQDTLHRARLALERRDNRALVSLADPSGLIVAAYAGTLPETGYVVSDPGKLLRDIGAPGGKLEVLGWRSDGRGRATMLTQGWQRRPLRLSPNSTLESTPVVAFGFVQSGTIWYWRVVAPDPTGALAQQARSGGWTPVP